MLHTNYDFSKCDALNCERIKEILLASPRHYYDNDGYVYVHIHDILKLYNCELISALGNNGIVKNINTSRCKYNNRDIFVHIEIEWENGKTSDIIDDDFIDYVSCGKIKIK